MLIKIENEDKIKYDTFYSHSKAVNESDITDSVKERNINISKYNRLASLAGSSYIKLPKELEHPIKDLLNIQNMNDNECLKWCIIKYLHPEDHHPSRIRKIDEILAYELDFEDIKFPVKLRDIQKNWKK